VGSAWVLSWTLPQAGHVTVISELTSMEMFSLLARRQREKTLYPANTLTLQNIFMLHAGKEYLVVPIDANILAQARQLVTKHPLRTLDAIQLSCAVHAVNLLGTPMTFISSDKNLLAAAVAEGFQTDDPNVHP
jgi:hypothetical protein